MLKSVEMRAKLGELQNKAREIMNKDGVTAEEISAAAEEIKILKAKITMQEQIEKEEKEAAENAIEDGDMEIVDQSQAKVEGKEVYNSAFANFVRTKGKIDLDAKNTMQEGVGEDGGFLVPVIDDTSVIKLREADGALQNLVRVIPISKPEGKKTVQKRHGNGTNFVEVGEGQLIGEGATPKFYKMDYSAKKYAAIYDITDEEFSDADEDVIAIMNEWIGNDSRCLRNNLIMQTLNLLPKTAIASPDDIKNILNKTIRTATYRYAVIVTNQSGFNWLDKLKDSDGNYLLEKDVQDSTKRRLFNKQVIVFDDEIMPNDTSGDNPLAPMIIGDLDNVIFFDRKNVEIRITDVGGDAFTNDKILMRGIEREDVQLLCDTIDELERDLVYGQINLNA